jgi:hypothetical protein
MVHSTHHPGGAMTILAAVLIGITALLQAALALGAVLLSRV